MITKKISKHESGSLKANARIYILVFFVLAGAAAIIFRLYNLQVLAHAYYQELADDQHKVYEDLIPGRGEIFARDGSGYYPLAVNRELSLAYPAPRELEDVKNTARESAGILQIDARGWAER